MSVKIKQAVANLEKTDFAYTFILESVLNVFGEPLYSSFGQTLFYFGQKCKLPNAAENVESISLQIREKLRSWQAKCSLPVSVHVLKTSLA